MIIVVVINMLISLMLVYTAWQVWQLKLRLANLANVLIAAERSTHAVLNNAPQAIYTSQQNLSNLRQRNQASQVKIQQVRQIFSLILVGQQTWRRYFKTRLFWRQPVAK